MDIDKLIATYNPKNVNITDEEIAAMPDLTLEQINALAEAYPNQPSGNAYLVYMDKKLPLKDQNYALGTWRNLAALRRINMSDIVAFTFTKKFNVNKKQAKTVAPSRTIDLSENEVKNAEGLKKEEVKDEVTQPANDNLLTPVEEAKLNLSKAKTEGAHPSIIKELENKLADAEKVEADKK